MKNLSFHAKHGSFLEPSSICINLTQVQDAVKALKEWSRKLMPAYMEEFPLKVTIERTGLRTTNSLKLQDYTPANNQAEPQQKQVEIRTCKTQGQLMEVSSVIY